MELFDYIRIGFSLIAVLGLIGLSASLAKRAGLGEFTLSAQNQKRLKIVSSLRLDAKRRAIILQCDSTEHLIITGGDQDIVVANNIPQMAHASATKLNTLPAELTSDKSVNSDAPDTIPAIKKFAIRDDDDRAAA